MHDVNRQLHSLLSSPTTMPQPAERMSKPLSGLPGSGSATPQRLRFLLPSNGSSSHRLVPDPDSPDALQRPHSAVRFQLDSALEPPPPQPAYPNLKPGLRINVNGSEEPDLRVNVSGGEEPELHHVRQQKQALSISAELEPPRQLRGSRGRSPAPVASDYDLWSFRQEQESTTGAGPVACTSPELCSG